MDFLCINIIFLNFTLNSYDVDLLNKSVRRTNVMYGGDTPDVKNVVFVNGDVDPWHALSVLKNLNIYSPSFLIKGIPNFIKLFFLIKQSFVTLYFFSRYFTL